MRIISGKARGTKLFTLDGVETRPTLDRVKESMFNIIAKKIPDSTVLDLFSGSGAIGLEFASRDAKKVYMCDNSKYAINIIKKNVEKTHFEKVTEILNCDFKKALLSLKNEKFDIVFIDPPYKTDYIKVSLEEIIKLEILNEDGLIILETDDENRILEDISNFDLNIIDQRKYGRANLIFVKLNGKG